MGPSQIPNWIGLVVETGCQYFQPLTFPQIIEVGLRVSRVGTTSVIYEIAIFPQGAAIASAFGRFVHVYVDYTTRKPIPVPERLRAETGLLTTPEIVLS